MSKKTSTKATAAKTAAKETVSKKAAKKVAEPSTNIALEELDADLLEQHNTDIENSIREKYKGHRIVVDLGKYDPNKTY